MSADVIPLHRDAKVRPDMGKIWTALDMIEDGDAPGLFAAAVAGLAGAQINHCRENVQGECDSLGFAFLALGMWLGIPRNSLVADLERLAGGRAHG